MSYEMKDMSGSLFRNAKKSEEKHPNATGSALIDGVEYWISAWTKETKGGDKWQSLAFTRKDKPAEKPALKAVGQDFNDEIPFN